MNESDVTRQEGRMNVLAIDPGPVESAFVIWDGERIIEKGKIGNHELLDSISGLAVGSDVCIIEQIKSYGMAVSDSIFDTVFWTGRFCQAWGNRGFFDRMPRRDVKMHLCGSMRAKDSNIRAALIDRFGEPGKKASPGVTYGLAKDTWAAFALAVTWYDQNSNERG